MKCGWMDWCGADYTDALDLSSLETMFGVDDSKPKTDVVQGIV